MTDPVRARLAREWGEAVWTHPVLFSLAVIEARGLVGRLLADDVRARMGWPG